MLWYFQLKVCFQQIGDQSLLQPRHGIKLGINRMFLKGDLLIRLEPLIDEIPVIGGIVPCQISSRFSRLLAILRAAPAIQWDSAVVICRDTSLLRSYAFSISLKWNFTTRGWQLARASPRFMLQRAVWATSEPECNALLWQGWIPTFCGACCSLR